MTEPLLVPVQLDALVVGPTGATLALGPDPAFEGTPRPLKPGVHLHWALPDALTTGRLARSEQGWTLAHPGLPDRWLVVRYDDPAEAQAGRRTLRAWSFDARTGQGAPLQRASQLGVDGQEPAPLTARGLGDAWYGRSRFGWHDELRGVASGPLSYGVFGWYGTTEHDPLWRAGFDAEDQEWPSLRAAWARKQAWAVLRHEPSLAKMDESFPDHLLLHGAVVDVGWGGKGGRHAGRPGPRDVRVGLYASAAEALGDLGAEADPRARAALAALAATIRQQPGVPVEDLNLELHAEGFRDDGARVHAADPVLAIRGGGRGFRHGHDGRFSPDGALRCRAGLSAVVSALAIDDPTPSPIPPVCASQVLQGLALDGRPQDEPHRRLLRGLQALVEEVALLDPSNAGLLASAWGGGAGSHESALTTVADFEVATGLCLATAHPGAAALADLLFRGAGILPSPIAITAWSQPWNPIFAEIELDVHGRLDGAPDSAALWRLGEAELEPVLPGDQLGILPVAHGTVRARVPLDGAVATAAGRRARPVRGYDAKGALVERPSPAGVPLAVAEHLGQLDLLTGTVAGVRGCAAVELGSDLPQGALRFTRLRLVDSFGTWVTLIGAPDGGRAHLPVEPTPPSADAEALGRATPPGPGYHALLRPRLAAGAALRCQWDPIAAWLRPHDGQMRALDAAGRPATGGTPGRDQVLSWLARPGTASTLSPSATLARAAELRALASLPGPGFAIVRAQLWLEAAQPLRVPDLRVRLGCLGSRDDGTLGWFLPDDPRLHLVDAALIDPDVWAEAGWDGLPSPDLCGGADLPLHTDAATELVLLVDPERFVYARSGFLPRCRLRVGR